VLERGSATPKQMARELGVNLENLSYHVRTLRDFGFIELERKRQVRGAVEHFYRLGARPQITPAAWEQLPAVVREALDHASIQSVFQTVRAAAEQDKLSRPESHIDREYAVFDEQGFADASVVVTEALDKIAEIEKASKARLRGNHEAEVPAIIVMMLFDAPQPQPAPTPDTPAREGAGGAVARR